MTSRLLIDGNNVMGARPDGWWRDRPGAMRALVEALDRLAVQTGDEITVVFDGRPRELSATTVEVAFASRRGRDAADDEIVRRVEHDDDPSRLVVVTSDGALADRVRAHGAGVEGAGAFRRRLDDQSSSRS